MHRIGCLSLMLTQILTPCGLAQPVSITSMDPATAVAGHYGTWNVQLVADDTLPTGTAIRIQLPDTWHAGARNSAIPLQATRPSDDHFVRAHTETQGVTLQTVVEGESDDVLVKTRRPSVDCREERYVFIVRVEVAAGVLEPGDAVTLTYGDRTGGGRGMLAGRRSTIPEPILGAVDLGGKASWEDLEAGPRVRILAGPPTYALATGQSEIEVGQPTPIRISVMDDHFNPARLDDGKVDVSIVTGEAMLPDQSFLTYTDGAASFMVTPTSEGILRLRVALRNGLMATLTNPMRVHETLPETQTFWGDLHSHSRFSWDGVGHNAFDYARNIAQLNFYALTDHSLAPGDSGCPVGLGPEVWGEYTALTDRHLDEGRFVTLHGYEASFGSPYGHHNVYFRSDPGPLVIPVRNADGPAQSADGRPRVTLPQLWDLLEDGNALTIPHHTGKFPSPVRWDPHDAEHRRIFELYSAHGLSESYDPEHPLAFEQSTFTSPGRSVDGPQFVHDAWMEGLQVSPIASSDDHQSQPGKPHWGLAAVQGTGLTREEIFEGLYQRRTYATTGSRILLAFAVNGTPMGQRVSVARGDSLTITSTVHGTGEIDVVELLRYVPSAEQFEVIRTDHPDGMDYVLEASDQVDERAIYYLRMRQRDHLHGRAVMAWSGPVWVDVVG